MKKIKILAPALIIVIAVAAYFLNSGPGGGQLAGRAGAPDATEPRPLNLFIWSEYIDPDVLANFEKTHNVKVRLDLYESNEEMISMLQTGRQGAYDLIVPTTYFIPSLIQLDLIQPINKELIPNLSHLAPRFTEYEEDPGNKYTVPYQWGTSGLVVRTDDPDSVNRSWSLVFDESAYQGNFVLFDTARDVLGSALFYLGYSANTTNLEEIKAAGDLLIEVKKRANFMGYNGGVDGLSKVVSGVTTIAQVYSGEAVKAAMEEPGIFYFCPKEGCEIWIDVFAIPKGAANVETAHEFLNYIMEPEISARVADFSMYGTPNLKAMDLIKKEDRENPAIYPDDELIKNMEYYKDLGDLGNLYEQTWTSVKSR